MAGLGPLGAKPRLAAGVSGGADSTALALLAHEWAARHGGDLLALIVDHGLRAGSDQEAALTAARLGARGIKSRVLSISRLSGAGIQEQARAARLAALGQAASGDGRLHVLLGHHAADQAETVAMRAARGPHGLEGMAAWTARSKILLLRPLLGMQPAVLRDYLRAQGMEWVEDPSNLSASFERVRVRLAGTDALAVDASARQAREAEAAAFMARYCTIRPEGFSVIHADAAPEGALSALVRIIGGAVYPPAKRAAAPLAAALAPATLAGVRILRTARFGGGWLLAREPAYVAPPVPAQAGAMWDGRFTLMEDVAPGALLGALGADAARLRKTVLLPSVVLKSMPCVREADGRLRFPIAAHFAPPGPAAPHPFQELRQ